jgi:hypothetical protein
LFSDEIKKYLHSLLGCLQGNIKTFHVTDLRLCQWYTVGIISVLEWIHTVDMSDIAEIPEVNISIFRVKLCGVDEFVCTYIYRFMLKRKKKNKGWNVMLSSNAVKQLVKFIQTGLN